jgi:hypothetical protein
MEPERSLPYSQVPDSYPYPENIRPGPRFTVWMFRYKKRLYGEELLAPSPNPQARGPPLVCFPRQFIQYILN